MKEYLIKYQAIGFMLISALSFTIMNGIVKYFVQISPYQMVFFRSIGSLVLCLGILSAQGISPFGTHKKLLIIRGIVGTISMTLFFVSFKYLPIGTAVTLRYLSPIFATLLAFIFFKEKVTTKQWLFFVVAVIGVGLLKGFDVRVSVQGLAIILGSAFFSGLVYFVISKIGKSEHPVVVVTYFMTISTLFGFFASVNTWYWPVGIEWLLVMIIGILGFSGQFFMTKALQIDQLSKVVPFKYSEAIFTICMGWIWFGESFGLLAICGMLLIIFGMVGNVLFRSK